MKTEGRRQSKNVEVQPKGEGKTIKNNRKHDELLKRDIIQLDNEQIRSKKALSHVKAHQSIQNQPSNPAYNDEAPGAKDNPNMRTFREGTPAQKKLDTKYKPHKAKIEHIKVKTLKPTF